MADGVEFPGLIPIIPEEIEMASLEARFQALEARSNVHSKFLIGTLEDDIVVTAGEILKWAIQKQGVGGGQSLYYFDKTPHVMRLILLACRAYGEYGANPDTEDLVRFTTMSQSVVETCNNVGHLENLDALERKVWKCKIGVEGWPALAAKYPTQCQIIMQYDVFKMLLPESFH